MDYSPLIMETVEMSLGEMETTPAAPRRSFPPSNLQLQVSVSVFLCFGGALLWKTSGGLFL